VAPAVSRTKSWRNSAGVDLLPIAGLQLRADLSSVRDLRDYGDATTVGRLSQLERRTLFGVDVGLETQRVVNTQLNFSPLAAGWLSVTTTSGARSSHAHATPLTTDATPGPSVVRQTPGRPDTSACAMAASAAPVSVAVRTNGMPARPAAAIRSRLLPPPGMPKMKPTPASRSAPTMRSATNGIRTCDFRPSTFDF